jgi:hypothetical protein
MPWLVLTVLIPGPDATTALAGEELPELGLLAAVLPHAASMTVAAPRPAAASHRFLIEYLHSDLRHVLIYTCTTYGGPPAFTAARRETRPGAGGQSLMRWQSQASDSGYR